jgi:hypothetical protein
MTPSTLSAAAETLNRAAAYLREERYIALADECKAAAIALRAQPAAPEPQGVDERAQERAFVQFLMTLPEPARRNIQESAERAESFTEKAFVAGWQARAGLCAQAQAADERPYCYTIGGDDQADCNGFVPCNIICDGEFQVPLYKRAQPQAAAASGEGEVRLDRREARKIIGALSSACAVHLQGGKPTEGFNQLLADAWALVDVKLQQAAKRAGWESGMSKGSLIGIPVSAFLCGLFIGNDSFDVICYLAIALSAASLAINFTNVWVSKP